MASAYIERPERIIAGNSVRLLVGGDQAYPAMLEAIENARHSCWLEVYAFADDWVGRLFADALAKQARAGVDVRVLVDALGAAMGSGTILEGLRARDVKVMAVFKLRPWRRAWRWFRRDHRKLLVVDHEVAFTGGLNIGLDYAGPRYGGAGWYDLQLKVRGPAVRTLGGHFATVWQRNGGDAITEPPAVPVAGEECVRVLANHLSESRKEIRHAYLHAFKIARKRILIANAYFLPGVRMWNVLRAAARRGVEVTLVLPGENDHQSFQFASRATYRGLLEAGARIFEMQGTMMHAKAAVVDGEWCTVGSCNLDAWSLRRNLELNVAVVGPRMASEVERHLRLLLPQAREITVEACRRWSISHRIVQFACLLFFMLW